MRKVLNIFFSNFKWYRKYQRGVWCEVTPLVFPEIRVWLQDYNESFEQIVTIEYYLK